jgi:hypothetical protein
MLLDSLEAGETIDDFLDGLRAVMRAQVIAFLEQAKYWSLIGRLRIFFDDCRSIRSSAPVACSTGGIGTVETTPRCGG